VDILVIGLISGVALGSVLFLLATGLSVVLGLMGIINLAHGAIFMAGAYAGVTVATWTGNFLLGILVGGVTSGMIGLVLQRGFLRQLYKRVLEQILVTFGSIYIIVNAIVWIWGTYPKAPFVPSLLSGSVTIGELQFPVYRLVVIFIGVVMCLVLWWLQDRTRIGAIIRAGMDDAQMVSGLGINLTPINIGAFFFGSFIAGLGGVIGIQVLGRVYAEDSLDILLVALTVCIIGGIGSVQGALVGALLIGIIVTFGAIYFQELAMFTMYLLMVLILLFRPRGLLGREV
jgi:branched-chain amino acid transport system permease protein